MKQYNLILAAVIICVDFIVLLKAQPREIPVDCPDGWDSIDAVCYKLFTDPVPYDSANKVCQTYGSELARPKDYYNNDDIGKYVDSMGGNDFWIGANRMGISSGALGDINFGQSVVKTTNIGYWADFQPDIEKGECVFVTKADNRFKWSFGPCERKVQFVCSRLACPQENFHCVNQKCLTQTLTCDGEDDCGDMSDEQNCTVRCGTVFKQASGNIKSKNFPSPYQMNTNCLWLVEVPLGSNAHIKFTDFMTEEGKDIVRIYVGGKTESTSHLVKSLSGNMSANLPEFTSSNNFMLIKFSSDSSVEEMGFKAEFSAKKFDFPLRKMLTAMMDYQVLTPPSYPDNYLGSQDYTWIIEASPKNQLITLEIEEVDLKGSDVVFIRDGDMVFHKQLLKLDATNMISPKFIFSSGYQIYITMQTRGYDTGKGFKLKYRQGCSIDFVASQGEISTPGFINSKYPNNAKCDYTIKETNGQPMTLSFDRFTTKTEDTLKVYRGANESGMLVGTFKGNVLPQNILAADGMLFLKFEADGTGTELGFSATFSVDCPAPGFNNNTITAPTNPSNSPDSRIIVSCKTGYHFAAEEFRDTAETDRFVSKTSVTMVCSKGGKWSTLRIPMCEPLYCGQAPSIINGYISSATGATVGHNVTYACYNGYTFADPNTAMISCKVDGTWESAPTCQGATCPSLPIPSDFVVRNQTGTNRNNFGAIYTYRCLDGYDLIGSPILFCQSDGTWTHAQPTCISVKCALPSILNGYITDNETVANYNDQRMIVCDTGFEVNDTSLTCMASGTFGTVHDCKDKDECLVSNGGCNGACTNTHGSFMCSCAEGFNLAADGKGCDDIDECADNMGGCSDSCTNSVGGYSCACPVGYELFTVSGVGGYTIKPKETGLMEDDVLRINHTCVRVQCPNQAANANSMLLSKNSIFRYEDNATYSCNIGYAIITPGPPTVYKSDKEITCTANGSWSDMPPICAARECEAMHSTLTNEPTFEPANKTVKYGEKLKMTCTYKDGTTKTRYRTCIYNQGSNSYSLEGDDYECGVIDCGTPPNIPGAIYTGYTASPNSSFGATFPFECDTLYTLVTNQTDKQIKCGADGKWDAGDLRCEGITCSDPGRPEDGTQNATSYEEGQPVYFGCSRSGFTLDSPYPIVCEKNASNTGLQWNGSVPNCIDTTKPMVTGCQSLKVDKYSLASLAVTMPTYSDNGGVKSVSVSPSFPGNLVITEDQIFIFQAMDFNSNEGSCITNISLKDIEPPVIKCPDSYAVEIEDDNSVVEVNIMDKPATVTDNEANPTLRYNPTVYTANINTLHRSQNVDVTATDAAGNTATCRFQIHTNAKPCSPLALPVPANAVKQCQNISGGGYTCNLICQNNYRFLDSANSQIITCLNGQAWNATQIQQIGGCAITDTQAKYTQTYEYKYDTPNNQPFDELCVSQAYRVGMENAVPSIEAVTLNTCSASLPASSFRIEVELDNVIKIGSSVYANYTFTIEDERSDNTATCGEFVKLLVKNRDSTINKDGEGGAAGPFSDSICPQITADINNEIQFTQVVNDFSCSNTRQRVAVNSTFFCLNCPKGYFNNNPSGDIDCRPCAVGEFSINEGATTCDACPPMTSTYNTGASTNGLCTAQCSNGSISSTTLPPCDECPRNTYWVNTTFCEQCPNGGITRRTGATSMSECQSACSPGYYSVDGFEPCNACPASFYSNSSQATECYRCTSSEITSSTASNSSSACISGFSTLCGSSTTCQNGGTCQVASNTVLCSCPNGFYGENCELVLNPCDSSPCKNNGVCNRDGNTLNFTCSCPQGTSGEMCEEDLNNCQSNPCSENGMCQDKLNDFTCLCKPGFKGRTCSETSDICQTSPCANGATCVKQGATRRKCNCMAGYAGNDCSVNINDCPTVACSNRGTCTDMVDSFNCSCNSGFTGNQCSMRTSLCQGVACTNGMCFDDYVNNDYRCLCNEGYMYNSTSKLCVKINYCEPDKCQNGATCTSNTKDFACSCMSGYTGSLCQHNIDDCSTNPCGPNAMMCTDELNNFNCTCKFGYTGRRCETMIPQCPTSNCKGAGVMTCNEKPGGIECVCKPGYTGINCETDINECAGDPCQHGFNCTDEVDGFKCNCDQGWSGDRCEIVTDNCSPSQCSGASTCSNLFNDYYCVCPAKSYGKMCENTASICTDANPCLNNQQCIEADNVTCKCSSQFSGKGCEIAVDYCAGNVCLNDGVCKASLTGYTCECKNGYEGMNCDVNPDNCEGVSCPMGATCIDGVNEYFCRCPLNKTGPMCDKDVDTNYDLYFTSPMKNGMAALPYPIHINSSQFTVSFWVRFWNKDDTGNILTIYFTESQRNTNVESKLLNIDSTGLKIMNGTEEKSFTYDFGRYNDGRWHHIAVTWDGSTGNLRFVVDSLSNGNIENFSTGVTWNKFLWVVLGAKYDPNTKMAVKNEGLRGWISQVSLYSRALDFRTEIPKYLNEPQKVFEGLIQGWSDYVLMSGVERIAPSMVKHPKDSCPRGFTGPDVCSTMIPGKTEVKVVGSCPSDVIVLGVDRITQVTWTPPVFSNSETVISTYIPESQFLWGKYNIIYQATSEVGNQALCSFDVFVQYDNCTRPDEPLNGRQIYTTRTSPNIASTLSCNSGFEMVQPMPDLYTCGPIGSWDPPRKYNTFEFPTCGEKKETPKQRISLNLVYKINTNNCPSVKPALITQIRNKLAEINAQHNNELCVQTNCSDAVITVDCVTTTRRRKRQTADTTAQVTLPLVPPTLNTNAGGTISPTELLNGIVTSGGFNFVNQIPGATADPNALNIVVVNSCPSGQTVMNDNCVECSAGTYYDASTLQCKSCAIGTYQENTAALDCMSCPTGTTTENIRSTSASDCKSTCPIGEFFDIANSQCSKCALGFHQNVTGMFFCNPCPADKTTRDVGATSEDQCFNDCPPGKQIGPNNGTCVNCTIKTYRGANDLTCKPCPDGTVTPNPGATSISQCTLGDCLEGKKRVSGSTSCEDCPIGTYQDKIHQTECISCGGSRFRTDQTASKLQTDCKFFCPDGQQQIDSQESCEDCAVGFYRNSSSNFYGPCTPCPPNYRTPSTKSVSEADCSIFNCLAGEKPAAGGGCEKCPKGTYQPLPEQTDCMSCPPPNTTRNNGSTALSDCESFCPSGQEKNVNGTCDICPRGYYKDNNIDVFSECTLCPAENITATTGSTAMTDCNIRNCSAGYKTVNNECVICPIGEYQDEKWQPSCKTCPTDTTTESEGADKKNLCILSCNPGQEDVNGTCVPCQIGFYKEIQAAEKCKACPSNKTTASTGRTAASDCSLAACPPGEYRNNNTNSCLKCDYGTYQPNKWMTSCLPCPTNRTTHVKGASNVDTCILDCAMGYEYDSTSGMCQACPRGEYRDKTDRERMECLKCPPGFITPTTGSTTSSSCSVRNCSTPGQYLDSGTNTCKDCPIGQYQDEKWQTQCKMCDSTKTTQSTGSPSIDSCKIDCIAGEFYSDTTNQCEKCPIGQYRNKTTWTCQVCPDGLSTTTTGAASLDDCTHSPCKVGEYYDVSLKSCTACEVDFYQPSANQFMCIKCPNGRYTVSKGADSVDKCLSVCADSTKNNCSPNANCVDDVNTRFKCTCKMDYIDASNNGLNCTHKCDNGYCGEHGTCQRDNSPVICTCQEPYQGTQCESRADPSISGPKTNEVIIIAVVTSLALLLFIILLVVCLCVRARRRHQKRKPFLRSDYDDRSNSIKNYDPYGSKAPSLGGQRLMLPTNIEKMYDNPVYDDDPAVYRA